MRFTWTHVLDEVKVKLSLCLTKHHAMKTWWSGGITPCILNIGSRGRRVVSFMTQPLYPGECQWVQATGWSTGVRITVGAEISLFPTVSRLVLGPTQPPTLPRGYSDRIVKLTSHLHPVPRLRMCGAIRPLPKYVFMTWCLV